MTCPSCKAIVPDEALVCPRCGVGIGNADDQPTVYTPSPNDATFAPVEPPVSSVATPSAGSDPRIGGRFPPGTLLAGRYRIVGIVGKGGMGEVYRADDLTLGQVVALKFLPPALVRDPEWLTRFRGEVRAARQVSHPNVCRVYDIGEADGQTFLSMELVGGEDLATLLRRIGRIGADKAAEIGRGLCAGLAAAHDKGVLHRDLKPANVLIDENGRVKLADFGSPWDRCRNRRGSSAPRPTWRRSCSTAGRRRSNRISTRWGSCCTSFTPGRRRSPADRSATSPDSTKRRRPPP